MAPNHTEKCFPSDVIGWKSELKLKLGSSAPQSIWNPALQMFSSEICMHRSISHRFTWLNGCRSRIIVAMIAESEVYLRYSAPTCTVSPAGKASFLHCSRSSLDLSLKSGREPLTVSSLGSTVFLASLAASTLL